jgi:hypothetical protein
VIVIGILAASTGICASVLLAVLSMPIMLQNNYNKAGSGAAAPGTLVMIRCPSCWCWDTDQVSLRATFAGRADLAWRWVSHGFSGRGFCAPERCHPADAGEADSERQVGIASCPHCPPLPSFGWC